MGEKIDKKNGKTWENASFGCFLTKSKAICTYNSAVLDNLPGIQNFVDYQAIRSRMSATEV